MWRYARLELFFSPPKVGGGVGTADAHLVWLPLGSTLDTTIPFWPRLIWGA